MLTLSLVSLGTGLGTSSVTSDQAGDQDSDQAVNEVQKLLDFCKVPRSKAEVLFGGEGSLIFILRLIIFSFLILLGFTSPRMPSLAAKPSSPSTSSRFSGTASATKIN